MKSRHRGGSPNRPLQAARPILEAMEPRTLLSFADGNGPVVSDLSRGTASTVVVSFDGPLASAGAEDPANYRVDRVASTNPEIITRGGPAIAIRSVSYDPQANQVTLTMARPLALGSSYRVAIKGGANSGMVDPAGTLFDGDNDDTPGGDFYGLLGVGKVLRFSDGAGNRATLAVRGGGEVQAWRGLNGDVERLTVVGSTAGRSTLDGSVRAAKGGAGQVVIPSIQGLAGVTNLLPAASFPSQAAPDTSPTPVVATSQNLAYSLRIDPVTILGAPSIQSAVDAQADGKWLLFGGRTNGLHDFDPSGDVNFPARFQNPDITVIDPATGQVWTKSWASTGLPASVTTPLSSTNQEFTQVGDRLYAVGGYSKDAATGQYTTYDTLTAMSVRGVIHAVIGGGDVASQIRQIRDPRLRVTGGQMATIGARTSLVFGQDFEGGYNGSNADFVQIYTDEVRSFRIVDRPSSLTIAGYQALRDPVQFRRRDYSLATSITPGGGQQLTAFGGVFTPSGNASRNPIAIGAGGKARVDSAYQQFFSQYNAPTIPLFDARTRAMSTVFFGGISLYDYSFATGTLSSDSELPFVDDVTSLVRRADGSDREYIMPGQLPGLLGADAAYFAAPGLPSYANGVVKLDRLRVPTTLGYIYGGIVSTSPNTTDPGTQTTSSNRVFKVTLVPSGAPL